MATPITKSNENAIDNQHSINHQSLTNQLLSKRWAQLKIDNPHTRARDAATQLGVSEAELVATMCVEDSNQEARAYQLIAPENNWGKLIEDLKPLGRVMALTRNTEAVHERKGEYSRTELFPSHGMGQVLDEGIDLRLFFHVWAFAFALDEPAKDNQRKRSIQFFSHDGTAIHKLFLQDGSNVPAFDEYVAKYKSAAQPSSLDIKPLEAKPEEKPDAEIDVSTFQSDWMKMTNTHEFFGLTREHNVTRTQALRLAPTDMAVKVDNTALRNLLASVAETKQAIMIFVGNPGCIQIHSGEVSNIKVMKEWLNVLDPDFNLHIREDLIHSSWIVRKPTTEGIVSSLELYNRDGDQIALIFSKRKDYKQESEAWRETLARLANR